MTSSICPLNATPSDFRDVNQARPQPDISELLPPRPENLTQDYTVERVREGLNYAERRLHSTNRKPSPNLSKLLAIYKSACEHYLLESENGVEAKFKHPLLTEIRTYEEEMATDSWFKNTDSQEMQRYKESLLKLRRYQYYARYGDYARRLAHKLRITACQEKIEDWDLISREWQWKAISDKIREEKSRWEGPGSYEGIGDVRTTRTVYQTCMALGANFDQMLVAIHTYGDRNEALHTSIENLMKTRNYPGLAEQISTDLNDLSSIIPIDLKNEETIMRAILLELRDRWFSIEQDDILQPSWRSWFPKQALFDECQRIKPPARQAAVMAKHTNDVLYGTVQRLQASNQWTQLVRQLSTRPQPNVLPTPGPQPTRSSRGQASRRISPKSRKKVWKAISRHQSRTSYAFNSSLKLQGEINRITSSYRASFGSSPPPFPPSSPDDLPEDPDLLYSSLAGDSAPASPAPSIEGLDLLFSSLAADSPPTSPASSVEGLDLLFSFPTGNSPLTSTAPSLGGLDLLYSSPTTDSSPTSTTPSLPPSEDVQSLRSSTDAPSVKVGLPLSTPQGSSGSSAEGSAPAPPN